MRRRPIEPVDVPRVQALLSSLRAGLGEEAVGERKRIALLDHPKGWLVEEEGDVVGVAPLVEGAAGSTFELATERAEVAECLVEGILEGDLPQPLRAWSLRGRHAAVLERLGFVVERRLHQLGVLLPLGPPTADEVVFRGFRDGDGPRWVEVNNRAFAGHAEQGALTLADFHRLTQMAWWDPDGLRLMEAGGEVVGFCWTKVHRSGVGEIYVIGLDPTAHGRGWGKALTLEGLRYLAEARGCREAMLYADGANESAIGMYRGLGFTVRHTDLAYVWDQPKLR